MSEKTVVDLSFAISDAADLLHSVLKGKGYSAFRFSLRPPYTIQAYITDINNPRFPVSLGLYHVITESEGGMRVEAYFPVTTPIDTLIQWIVDLPGPVAIIPKIEQIEEREIKDGENRPST